MSHLFAKDDHNTGVSASASFLPVNIQGWSPSILTRLICLLIKWVFHSFAVQGTFRSLLQHHSSKASILWCSAFFMVQLSQPYVTTGKTIPLTIQIFVSRIMSLLFTLSRFVMAFLPRSNHLLISWLQSPSAVVLEPKKIKSVSVNIFSPSICREEMGSEFVANRWGNSGNSVRLYFLGLQNHCKWWLQPWN